MLRRIPKVLLLVALLTALAVSSTPILGNSGLGHSGKVCDVVGVPENCTINKNGECHTSPCKKGEPCSFSACGKLCILCL